METTMNDGEVASKKRKIDQMVDGSIVTVELHNFMSFTKVIYKAHPKLNLIIGPNGSGKSSIVTALMLGFGGNPKDINRGEKVSQFVKQGKTEADIYIELYKKANQNVKLRRTIFVTNDSCHYYINNIKVSKIKYIGCIESFNIKVHNLCQFLPQDRLEDFSKLDSKGLLLNALQSIENQDLLEKFNLLKELANSLTSYDDDLNKLKNSIKSEVATNLKLETIVTSFTEKQTLEKELLTVLQKRYWILYVMLWEQIKNANKKLDNAKKLDNHALKVIDQQREIIKKKKTSENNLKTLVLRNASVIEKLLEKINDEIRVSQSCITSINKLNETAKNSSTNIEDHESYILSRENKIESMKKETINVEAYKEELNVINKKILNVDGDILSKKSSLEKIKNKLRGLTGTMYAINQEIERERRKEDGKNQLLQRQYPDLWKAINWLRNCEQKSIFRGQVFEPLFTQIEVLDKNNAKYIENIINYRDMIAFVFEFAEDLTKFNEIVEQQGWNKINSISAPPANIQINETPNYDMKSLKQYGFNSYAMDMIKAPFVIRRYLAINYDMHNKPIGSEKVMDNIHRLPNNIKFFFAGNNQVILNTSAYTGEKITRQTQISNDAQFLIFSVDSNLIQTLTMKKKEVGVEIELFEKQDIEFSTQLSNIESSRQSLFKEKRALQDNFTRFQNRQQIFNQLEVDVEFRRNELKKEKERTTQFSTQNLKLIDNYLNSMKEISELMNNYANLLKSLKASSFIANNRCVNVNEDYKVLKQLRALYMSNLVHYDEYLKYIEHLECALKKVEKVALQWTRGVSPYDKTFNKSIKPLFDSIEQNDVEDLDELITEKKVKLNCLNVDPNATQLLNEYKERKIKIKNLEEKLNNLNENREKKENKIEKLHTLWFPKLQELSVLLNSNFQKFLTLFGCKGLIELHAGLTTYDFEDYGLLIKVQFRNDVDMNMSTMRLLDAKSQSGGERALTTALFLLALQEVTHFPFRVVDEINQGMDKVNEKKLMELFMDLFEDRNNQYLVVTPKLIKNLSFRNTTVDIIFSLEKESENESD